MSRRMGLAVVLSVSLLSVMASKAYANTLEADCDGWHLFSPEIPEQGTAFVHAKAQLSLQTGVDGGGNPIYTPVGSIIEKCALVPDVDSNPGGNDAGYDFQMPWDPPLADGTYIVNVVLTVYIVDDPLNAGFPLSFWEGLAANCSDPSLQNPAPTRRRRASFVSTPFTCQETGLARGCTPGFWKQPHHFFAWPATVSPNTLFVTVFGENAFPGLTLFQVLWLTGGGLPRLGSHTVAAYLNASTLGGGSYGFSPAQVIAMFQAVYPGTKDAYNGLKDTFEAHNEQGCPFGSENSAGAGGSIEDELGVTGPATFRRGDSNANGGVDIADAIVILESIFIDAEKQVSCADAADLNDDGMLDISDPVGILQALFLGAEPIRFPGSDYCGIDLSEDNLPACDYAASCIVF